MDLGLKNRSAVVLASSTGLGFAIARALAEEGARVALSGRDPARIAAAVTALQDQVGDVVFGEALDVADGAALEVHLRNVQDRFGVVDILVTNAGGPPPGRAADLTVEALDQAYALTLKSAVQAIGLVLPGMRERRWGRIIAVTSSSVREPIPNLALSNTMRPGLTGYLKTLSAEVAGDGVLVNSVCTGAFDTDRLRSLCRARAEAAGTTPETIQQEIGSAIPAGRVGRPEEFGALVAFLASERASFLAGAAIPIDGGAGHGIF